MADQNDAHALGGELLQNFGEALLERAVQTLGWLVQQENLRFPEKHFGQSGPLLLPTGQVIRMPVQQPGEVAEPENPFHAGPVFRRPATRQTLPQVLLQDVLYKEKLWILGEKGHGFT